MRAIASPIATAALAAAAAWAPRAADAFVPASHAMPMKASTSGARSATACDIPDGVGEAPSLVGVPNGADAIKSAVVTGAAGELVRVDDAMRSGGAAAGAPHVVIYLRHMGWPYCWSYAKEWCGIQQQLEEAGIGGPTFVSIGDAEKLNTFLDANEWMPRDRMFVDDYSFDAYKSAGFGRFDEVDKEAAKGIKLTAPELSFGEWITYARNVGKVSPVPKDFKFGEVPEGVLWVGGTFVIQGDDVLYQWNDTVPGNHPVIGDVVKIAKEAAQKRSGNNLLGIALPW